MIQKILDDWKKVGMDLFWGDLFDCRFLIADLLKKSKKDIILDLSCGPGIILHESNASLKIGLDLDIKKIHRAKKLNGNLQLICGDIRHLPFRDNFFKNILSIHSLSSLNNSERRLACNEIKRVISKKNSNIIFSAANIRSKHYPRIYKENVESFIHYNELIELFNEEYRIEIFAYNSFPKVVLFILRKIFLNLPKNSYLQSQLEKCIFKILKTNNLKEGRAFVMICQKEIE